jgi:large subunit ribosomal protein L32
MGVPKRRVSKARKSKGRTAWMSRLKAPNLVECPHCHNLRVSHRVCPECGYYDGKEVIAVIKKG